MKSLVKYETYIEKMPEICRKRRIQAPNGLEEETYRLAQLLNESEMTSQHLGSFSSNKIAASNLMLDIAKCRSLESIVGRVAAEGYPQEIVLVQNLKLRERLRYLCRCKDTDTSKPCDERQCPNIRQRFEKHRLRCQGTKNLFCKSNSFRNEESPRVPTKIFMYDKSIQTSEIRKINDAATNWDVTEHKQKTTSPKASIINDYKRICNSASTMATIDYMRKTRSTMAATDVLRQTQSCNTTVSFKNFYKDRLQYEVLQWLREVPIVAEFNSSTRVATEKTVNNLIDGIYKLSAKANCDTYECKLYSLINQCIETLPVSYHSVKCDKTKRVLIESLITRIVVLNNRYIFSSSNTSSTIPSFYPCGFNDFATYASMEEINEQPITKSYRKDINNWVQAKKFKRKDGKYVNKTDVTEKLLDRLFPLLYDKQTKNYKYLIRGGIVETLNNFALATTGSNSRLYLDDLATDLTNILLRTRAGYKPALKSSNVSSSLKNFFSNPKNFLHRLRKRRTVSILVDSKESPAPNSKTFFRNEKARSLATVSSEMSRCCPYYTSQKIPDLRFKLVNNEFPELRHLHAITDNIQRLIALKSLFMTLNAPKNMKIKTLYRSNKFGPKQKFQKVNTDDVAIKAIYNCIFICWVVHKTAKEYKTFYDNRQIRKKFKYKLKDHGVRITTQKIVSNSIIMYGSSEFSKHPITYKQDILVN